ncbi:unnamed protein product [Sphenostylis stenocarpa]|uniref:Uncharacterized protein n=1 Tax=Sphenostylis stenocarpa TaxID=92480 RepID=A0AA86T6W5_9FABA|nr:unnamed protein product [Sphenostylis stenocarpa]
MKKFNRSQFFPQIPSLVQEIYEQIKSEEECRENQKTLLFCFWECQKLPLRKPRIGCVRLFKIDLAASLFVTSFQVINAVNMQVVISTLLASFS